jgi:hypothetical protein
VSVEPGAGDGSGVLAMKKTQPEGIRRAARELLALLEESPGPELLEYFARERGEMGEEEVQFLLMMLKIMAEENPYEPN